MIKTTRSKRTGPKFEHKYYHMPTLSYFISYGHQCHSLTRFSSECRDAMNSETSHIQKWTKRKYKSVIFRRVISRRNSVSQGNKQIRITSKYGFGFDPIYGNEFHRKTTAESGQVQVLFTTHGNILTGGMGPVQLSSRNVWISRLPAVTVLLGDCLRSVKPYRTASHDLRVNSPQKCTQIQQMKT